MKKAQQCLYFLRRLRSIRLSPKNLTTIYYRSIESNLTSCISVWYTNCTSEQKTLQRVGKMVQHITGTQLQVIKDSYHKHCLPAPEEVSHQTQTVLPNFSPQALNYLNMATRWNLMTHFLHYCHVYKIIGTALLQITQIHTTLFLYSCGVFIIFLC